MNRATIEPHGQLITVTPANQNALARRARSGAALRLSPGLYAVGATLPTEQVARHHLYAIAAHYWPGAVLCGRTALAGGVPQEGFVFLAHPDPPRPTELRLPGLRVVPVVGPGPLPGDMSAPEGLTFSGPARVLVENINLRGRPAQYRAGTVAVEDRIDELARSGGAGRIRTILSQLDVIAGSFDPAAVVAVRSRLSAVLGSFSEDFTAASGRLAARLSGAPFDAHRIEMLEGLASLLEGRSPRPVPAAPPTSRWEWLPFFEAYFSNFIEGTEFGVDEARRIAVEGVVPAGRSADAHDVSATYRLAIDPIDRSRTPASGQELTEILKERHLILMAARPDKRPGEFKEVLNFAGGYQFVEPELVEGTLQRGFVVLDRLQGPFARATAMMLLVTECHPFDDGNGRVARLTSNAELSSAGEVRIVVPAISRNDYLAALSGMSAGAGRGESLCAVLEFLQRWTSAVDWTSYGEANEIVAASNAYLEPGSAAYEGHRLEIPGAGSAAGSIP